VLRTTELQLDELVTLPVMQHADGFRQHQTGRDGADERYGDRHAGQLHVAARALVANGPIHGVLQDFFLQQSW
jgi:hypothetical protein